MLKRIILTGGLVMAAIVFSGFSSSEATEGTTEISTPKWILIHDVHYVMNGESLDEITKTYMAKNTYGPREFKEFREGIIELNNLRDKEELHIGQELSINYWVKPEDIIGGASK